MTRLLLAGTGLIGERHLAHIDAHPDLTLAGIVDPDPARRAHATAPGFASFDDVDVPVDGVVIATPTASHAPLTIDAVRRGWHVLVEKPVADTLSNADAMIAAARGSGVNILVGHHRRHHPRVAKLHEVVTSGRIGVPVAASLLWLMRKPDDYFDVDWRAGIDGAPIKQNLIHDVDTLRWLFGEVTDVVGLASNAVRGAARPESGGAVLRFDGGVTATLTYADTTPTPWGFEAGTGESPHIPHTAQDSLRIAGTLGGVEFPSLRVWSGATHWNEAPHPSDTQVDDGVPLVRQLEHFADVIAGRADPIVDAASARRTLDVILQIEATAGLA
ncbi:Gfo/Idh/MocA family protein [Jannaschia donghaensis]|uniref:4-carboxy-2-hydroxymuconate-6-semialdehyde dehydrogenase n=1 Tax=Jannaschia donghaensis TaxID=420998 RepID=A0A0M6YKA0_9RHOB|nr:Gfo/Idh/MocA family oxidoreductase [Jannaschia donghaensis]CTQ50370.1 4-carboxy-2-hydroxymuconate-6-semialdehyde dehydrogenase [Jannaschia donghaensis]